MPQAENAVVQQENVGQNGQVLLNDKQQQDGGQQEGISQLPEDLEQLLEDVGDGELDPQVQQVLEIQHQAGVGEGQLNTQEFEGRFFVQ